MTQSQTKSSDLIGQREERVEKLKKLIEMGINPFPAQSHRTHTLKELKDNFSEHEGKKVAVIGRIVNIRKHGKLIFIDLVDQDSNIQIMIRKDQISNFSKENQLIGFDEIKLLDTGDFIQISGDLIISQSGEITVACENIKLLTKSIRPLPTLEANSSELSDKELRYRRRYLDFATDNSKVKRFIRKSKFWQEARNYLNSQGFIEVETPVLEHRTGGADANPFITHHNTLDIDLYLRISSELAQKRLIGGGFEKVYTLGPNFRNEGTSDEHLQEYYQLEWYWAYADYKDQMELVKNIIRHISEKVYGKSKFTTRGHTFDVNDEWIEIDYQQVLKERFDIDIFKTPDEELQQKLIENGIELSGEINRNRLIDNLWKIIRKDISGPAFLINEPKFMSPLAKSKQDNPELTERFHVILAGSELGNGYTEINDPMDQLERFAEQEKLRLEGDDEAQMLDIDFVEMLEYGMPPVTGFGMSERVFWFMEDITAREGTLFPLMREEIDKNTKQIYGDIVRTNSSSSLIFNGTDSKKINYPSTEYTMNLLRENVTDEYQLHHAEMVGFIMQGYANKAQQLFKDEYQNTPHLFDPNMWLVTGLIHDWDYQFDPEGHPENNIDKLAQNGYPEIIQNAILAHKLELNVTPESRMAQALIAIDELAGIFFAYNKFKKGYENMTASKVMKKFKDKAFAAKINREDILFGVEELGVSLEEHIQNVLDILQDFPSKD